MANYTLTYSESAQGFPSFYSYYPDMMIGMNNYFYTFRAGNLYRHNVNPLRNTFYADYWTRLGDVNDAFVASKVISVFNDVPLENKLFKTLNIEGDAPWGATMVTDIQNSGAIEQTWFQKKEQSWYGFVRNTGTNPATAEQYDLRSLNGIGNSLTATVAASDSTVYFALTTELGSILSVGDNFYFVDAGVSNWAGTVLEVNVDLRRSINNVKIDTTPAGTVAIPGNVYLYLYIKNSIAESHGVLGHYCTFEITNDSTSKIELFAVESEVMKSFP